MFTLGLAGGLDPVDEQRLDSPENSTYDAAAVLVRDGVVVAAVEEERLDRIKHSNKLPLEAIRFCLRRAGIALGDVARIGYYVDEAAADAFLARMYLARPEMPARIGARALLHASLRRGLGCEVDPEALRFYEHRLTHAACAMHQSGFGESLVFVVDNAGGMYAARRDASGKVALELLEAMTPAKSLQRLCHSVLPFLGLGMFDEHKAIALAAYGDAARFAPLAGALYELLPGGSYRLHLERAAALLGVVEPRREGAEPSQDHHDLAASLQRAMERIVLHVLAHYRSQTGLRRLCMAGGMSENTSTNGAVLDARLFDDVFVHPAAYDSGCAIGAALLASDEAGSPSPRRRVTSVRWGAEPGEPQAVAARLASWNGLLRRQAHDDAPREAARLIAGGAVLGWVDGRSEFGSRALGARNVLADARSAESRRRVHRALGRGESYRPLAAIVLRDDLRAWCDLPDGVDDLPFQTFAVRVREERRAALGGAMQADGRARVQTVAPESEPALARLIVALGERTGTRAVLSTSFNTGAEPVVESVDDAVASFLCSGIDALVVGDAVATKTAAGLDDSAALHASLPPYVRVVRARGLAERRLGTSENELRTTYSPGPSARISRELADALIELDGETPLGELLRRAALDADGERRLFAELLELWRRRLVVLRPPARVEAPA